jgi:hypothetical protein
MVVNYHKQTLGRRGPRSLDDLITPRGERPMTHPKPASFGSQILWRRGPRSLDELATLCGERPMTHPKPVSSGS